MAYKGKRIYNPVNQQAIEFVTTAKDSQGRLLEMISTWQPSSQKPAAHYHPHQDEVFTVLDGELTVLLRGQQYTLKKGESIHIKATTVHAMWNESLAPVVAKWEVCPAGNTEYFLETGMGLASDGKTNSNGMPGLLQVVLMARKFRNEFRLHKPPYLLQTIVFSLLTPLALISGKKAVYPKYID